MSSTGFSLVVGLGNPGDRYLQTRHNAGFWFVDELARHHGGVFRADKKFHGDVARITIDGRDCLLLKPMTFMNRSGLSVASMVNFYRFEPASVLVAHDEIDLPPGSLRIKRGGGHGGHNGLRDIAPAIGSSDFWRLRIGVGHPGHRDQVVNYVLSRSGADEQRVVDAAIADAVEVFSLLLAGDISRAQQTLHTR